MTGPQQDDPAETLHPSSHHIINLLEEPRAFDVLFGRGRGAQEHLGNVVLQEIVKLHRERYQRARRKHRNGIAQEIVQNMKHGGPERQQRHVRFLKHLGEGVDEWVEVSDKDAAQKVCHALRVRPPIFKQGGGNNNNMDEGNDADLFPSYDVYSPDNTQSYNQMSVNQQQYHQSGQTMPSDLNLEIAASMNHRFCNPFLAVPLISQQQQQQQQQQAWRLQGEAYPSPLSAVPSQAATMVARNPQSTTSSTTSSCLLELIEERNPIYYEDQILVGCGCIDQHAHSGISSSVDGQAVTMPPIITPSENGSTNNRIAAAMPPIITPSENGSTNNRIGNRFMAMDQQRQRQQSAFNPTSAYQQGSPSQGGIYSGVVPIFPGDYYWPLSHSPSALPN
jgi:hypothetical protein